MTKKANAAKSVKKGNDVFHAAIGVFLAGCAAECYLLLINKYLIRGTLEEVLAMADAMPYFIGGGAAVLVLGAVLLGLWWKKGGVQRTVAAWIAGAGAFVALASYICLTYMADGTRLLCTAVPVAMLLGVVFLLYQREFFFSAGSLAVALMMVSVCRKSQSVTVRAVGIVVILLLLAELLLARKVEQGDGKLGEKRLFPRNTDYLCIYIACALGAVGVAVSMLAFAAAYYVMWVLGVVLFAIAVYYTVKQL